jgi:hypothetical protein
MPRYWAFIPTRFASAAIEPHAPARNQLPINQRQRPQHLPLIPQRIIGPWLRDLTVSAIRRLRLPRDDSISILLLNHLKVFPERVQIAAELLDEFLAGNSCFLDDRIFPHDDYPTMSSSGVQIYGGSKPAARQILSTRGIMNAFCVADDAGFDV